MGLTGFNRARRAQEERVRESAGVSAPAVSSEKAALVAKALELELGTEDELNALTEDELSTLIADVTKDNGNSEKAALVAKAQALKEAHPKEVKASPSAIPNMSVEKLTKLIADAEAAIAAGSQE
jgi:hypothetical protein